MIDIWSLRLECAISYCNLIKLWSYFLSEMSHYDMLTQGDNGESLAESLRELAPPAKDCNYTGSASECYFLSAADEYWGCEAP